jgi:cobalt/nickel transport system permease protein
MSGSHGSALAAARRSCAGMDSPVHRAPASLKLLATLVLVTGVALVPAPNAVWTVAALALVAGVVRVARIPLSVFVSGLALAQPFVLGVAVLALFQGRGLTVFAALAIKSTACVAAVQALALTTRFDDLLDALRRARLPRALITTLALLHRYSFVLVDESMRMRRARMARTWPRRTWTSPWSRRAAAWTALSSVIAVSFVRSVTRAERIATAMRARGWS